ncbi:MAG: GH25 family lysozyme [Bacteroidota bacterium]
MFSIFVYFNFELISYYIQITYYKLTSKNGYVINKSFKIFIPENFNVHGIDVSVHQSFIKWDEVTKMKVGHDSIDFVYIKATEGKTHKDIFFKKNWIESKKNDLIRGAYHFYLPYLDGKSQADNFIGSVTLEKGDLPPVLDIEKRGKKNYKSFLKELKIWLTLVEKHYGVKPIIYTNLKFYEEYLNTEKLEGYTFWIAHYYVQELNSDSKWMFWQHNDRGCVSGINSLVDFNIFKGSLADLKKMTVK